MIILIPFGAILIIKVAHVKAFLPSAWNTVDAQQVHVECNFVK